MWQLGKSTLQSSFRELKCPNQTIKLRGEERLENDRQAMLAFCQGAGFWNRVWPDKCSEWIKTMEATVDFSF